MPFSTDEFVGCQAVEGLESLGVVVGEQEGVQMVIELRRCLIMIEFDGGIFDRSIHSFDLAVGPRTGYQSAAVFDVVLDAELAEWVGSGGRLVGQAGKLYAVVCTG